MDNKDLKPGSTLYFRVNVPGAMFSAGDGHGAQGDGAFLSINWHMYMVISLTSCLVNRRVLRHRAGDFAARPISSHRVEK